MDREVDRGAKLIARNRDLLARAAEARAWSGEAQQRANETVQTMMESRLAWARRRQRRGWAQRHLSLHLP